MSFNSLQFVRKIAKPYSLWERVWIYFLFSAPVDCLVNIILIFRQKQTKYLYKHMGYDVEEF